MEARWAALFSLAAASWFVAVTKKKNDMHRQQGFDTILILVAQQKCIQMPFLKLEGLFAHIQLQPTRLGYQ